MHITVKPIKSIADLKTIYAAMDESYKESMREKPKEPFPIIDTYNQMLENLKCNKKLQLKAEISGVLAGAIVTAHPSREEASIFVRAIFVRRFFQKQGVARKLLKIMEKNLRGFGFSTLKIYEREGTNGFFIRSGFIPYLYIVVPDNQMLEKVKEANFRHFKILHEKLVEDGIEIKFDVEEEAVYADKKNFLKLDPSIKADFIYEKIIGR